MSEEIEYQPEWLPDCQGKQDYDFDLVALSCRYYPRGGGFSIFQPDICEWQDNEDRPEIRPSAVASICIGDLANGPYETLASADFVGDTESDVKAKVEAWAREQMARVVKAMHQEFAAKDAEVGRL